MIVLSAVAVIPLMFAFHALGLSDELAVFVAIGIFALVTGLLIARGMMFEARRQGWGSNIWPPVE